MLQAIEEYTNIILNKDPGAIVIFLGDHGPANLFAKIFNLIGNEEGVHFEEAPNEMYLLMGTDPVTIR